MNLEWTRIERWQYIVDAVASDYSRKFNTVDYEDIRQSLYQWFLEHPNKLDTWEAIGDKDAKNLIYRSLRNQALDYCQHWKAKSGGYDVTDLFYYEAGMVEAILPSVLRGEHSAGNKVDLGRPGTPSAPNEGGNLMAMMIEIDWGFWKLPKEDRQVLFMRHAESMDFSAIASALTLGSDDAARMRHKRAIKKLINRMGGFRPFKDEDEMPQSTSDSDDSAESNQNPSG